MAESKLHKAAAVDACWVNFNGFTPTWGSEYFDYEDYSPSVITIEFVPADDSLENEDG